jgi:hypothetical protein
LGDTRMIIQKYHKTLLSNRPHCLIKYLCGSFTIKFGVVLNQLFIDKVVILE